jgi:hypothetical protein
MSLGTPEEGFQSVTDSGVTNSQTVRYVIEDGANFEIGSGVFTTASNSLTRTVLESTNSNNRINATADALVMITVAAEDIVPADGGNFTGSIGVTGDITVTGTVDGVDIATRDTVLTSTTTTANNALPKAGGTMTGNLILDGDPTIALQGATKQYVDTIAAAGIHYHQPVRCQATANLTATYNNGSSGVGATLTNSGAQAALVIDGVTVSTSDRVLIQLQTNQVHNGVYTVTNIGSGSTNWVLTRATDADSYAPSDPDAFGEGDAFFVTEGTVHGGELDVMTTSGVITFGTTNIVFALVSDAPIYTAGTGMSITGTEFSIGQAVGTSDTPTFAGGTFTDDVSFPDNEYVKFGNSNDVTMGYFSFGPYGFINNESGDFYITNNANGKDIILRSDNGSGSFTEYFTADGSTGQAKLHYYGTEKIKTTSVGVDISGYADVDNGMRHNGNATNEILFGSNTQTFKTNGSDRIYITNTGVSIYPSLFANSGVTLTDSNSTITRPSSSNIAFNAAGAERARVNSDGVTVKTGRLAVQDTSTAGTVRFHEAAAGANYVDVIAPSSLGADYTVTLPAETGTVALEANVPGKAIAMAMIFG